MEAGTLDSGGAKPVDAVGGVWSLLEPSGGAACTDLAIDALRDMVPRAPYSVLEPLIASLPPLLEGPIARPEDEVP